MKKSINSWEFANELYKIPSKTRRTKNKSTSKKYIDNILQEYRSIILGSEIESKYLKGCKYALEALKTNKISFRDGFLTVSSISEARINSDDGTITLTLSGGKQICLTDDFYWINYIF